MRLSTFEHMLKEYSSRPIDMDDLAERDRLLSLMSYTVIFEGDFIEFEHAEKWLAAELNISKPTFLFYGKLGYDYGFFEFFFSNQPDADKFSQALPGIFSVFPNGQVMKTDGLDHFISQTQ